MYAIYREPKENEKRLYNGFILYIMFGIDVFLIVAIIIGTKLDSKDIKSRPVQPSKTVD
jgi:hypothetical protein